jgi:hypothetical protein
MLFRRKCLNSALESLRPYPFPFLQPLTSNIQLPKSHSFGDELEPRYIFGAEPLDQ